MKPYRDVFGNPLPKQDIVAAVRTICQSKRATSSLLTRRLGLGYGKVLRIMEVLEDAAVVGPQRNDATRTILLKHEDTAINAALRQLKKGRG